MKLRIKRVSALLLSVLMLVMMLPLSGMVLVGAAADTVVKRDVYVDAAVGVDSNSGAPEAPVQTVGQALTMFAGVDEATIVLLTNASLPGEVIASGLNADGVITIKTAATLGSKAELATVATTFRNNTVLDNVRVTSTLSGTGYYFALDGISLTTTANFENTAVPEVAMAADRSTTTRSSFTARGGKFGIVWMAGSSSATAAISVAGADITIDGGEINSLYAYGRSKQVTTVTDDINLNFISGKMTTGQLNTTTTLATNWKMAEGQAIKITHAFDFWSHNPVGFYATSVAAFFESTVAGGRYVVNYGKKDGVSIQGDNSAANTFAITGNMNAEAVLTADAQSAKVSSVNGVLTLPTADEYDISWVAAVTPLTAYVDSTVDTTGNGSRNAPYKTLAEALNDAAGRESATIYVAGTVALDTDIPATKDGITITSTNVADPAKVQMTKVVSVKSNLTLGALQLGVATKNSGHSYGFNLAGVKFTTEDGFESGWLNTEIGTGTADHAKAPTIYAAAGVGETTATKKNTIELHSGTFASITFGGSNTAVTYADGAAVDVILDGAYVNMLFLFSRGSGNTSVYNDNINVMLRKGQLHGVQVWGNNGSTEFADGKGLRVVKNAEFTVTVPAIGVVSSTGEASKNNIVASTYWMNCVAQTDGTLIPSDASAGSFTVDGNKEAVATITGGAAVSSIGGFMTVPSAGTYTVDFKYSLHVNSIYVDSVGGSDDNSGTSYKQPLKTLSAAVAKFVDNGTPVITVVNTVDYDTAALAMLGGDMTLTMVGWGDDAVLTYGGADMVLSSDLVLRNLLLKQNADNVKLVTNGHNLHIGVDVTFTHDGVAGLENPVIVTGKADDAVESLVIAGAGCASLTVGSDAAGEHNLVLKGVPVQTVNINSSNAASVINMLVDASEVQALCFADDAVYASLQVIAENGGSILGDVDRDNTWYIRADGVGVSLTESAGTYNVTVPAGQSAVAIDKNGSTVYVADNKSATDKAPITNYRSTKYDDWNCFDYGSYLTNSYNKLTQDKKLNVVYFGGSLTAGYGVGVNGDPNGSNMSPETHSWRALSGQWLKTNFPEADVNLINCAIGESGTFLGTYRVQEDIIPQKPDLLFIEYAINDNYHQSTNPSAEKSGSQLETIVREVKQALPSCDIVVVLTTDYHQRNTTYTGGFYETAQGHYAVAKAYHLPIINLGLGLLKGIVEVEGEDWLTKSYTSAEWAKYFCDTVHPYSTGHAMYYACIKEFLENNFLYSDYTGLETSRVQLPPVYSTTLLDGNRVAYMGADMKSQFVSGVNATYSDAAFSAGSSGAERSGHYVVAGNGSITFRFTGTEVALWTDVSSGKIFNFTIDSGDTQTMTASQHNPAVFATGLTSGTHTITVSVADGTAFKIAALFERDATKQTVQGATHQYIDKNAVTLTVPVGSYTVTYALTVGNLPIPSTQDGKTFVGWMNGDGELLDNSTALTPGMTLTAKFAGTSVRDIYVNTISGLDGNAGTVDAPVATIDKALALLDGCASGTIHLMTDAALPATIPAVTTEGPITIKSVGTSNMTLALTGALTIRNDIVFDNVTMTPSAANLVIHLDAVALETTAMFSVNIDNNKQPNVYMSAGGSGRSSLTVDSAAAAYVFNNIFVTPQQANFSGTSMTMEGADITLNGNAKINGVFLCQVAGKSITYTKNVNVTLNGKTEVYQQRIVQHWNNTAGRYVSFADGAALQIVRASTASAKPALSHSTPAEAEALAVDAKLYDITYNAQEGCSIISGTAAGLLTVVGELVASAKQGEVQKAESVDGLLTLPQAGAYTVAWKLNPTPYVTYVNVTGGSDENDGTSAQTAYATIGKAVEAINDSLHASGTIYLVGTVSNGTKLPSYAEKPIVIEGADATAELKGNITFGGPTTLRNLKITAVGASFLYAGGYPLTIGDGVTTGGNPFFFSGVYNGNNAIGIERVTVNGGNYTRGHLAPQYATGAGGVNNVQGVLYTQNGGNIERLELGSGRYGGKDDAPSTAFGQVTYNGNVNFVINAGQVGEIVPQEEVTAYTGSRAVFNGHVQVIMNGTGIVTAPLKTFNGALGVWKIDARNADGYGLQVTDVAGTYTLNDAARVAGVMAVAYDTNGHIAESVDGTLTLTAAGDYTVKFVTALPSYINAGTAVKFYQPVSSVDFEALVPATIDGQMFVGWKNGDSYPDADTALAAGTVLTAEYTACAADDFIVGATQLRDVEGSDERDLRFILSLNMGNIDMSNIQLDTSDGVGYGAVAIPNVMLTIDAPWDGNKLKNFTTGSQVTVDGSYYYNGKQYNAIKVPAVNLFTQESVRGGNMQYTICLTNIPMTKYTTRYAVRGYIQYIDANGEVRVQYSNEMAESLTSTTQKVIESFPTDEDATPFTTLMANARASVLQKYQAGQTALDINQLDARSGLSYSANDFALRKANGELVGYLYKQFNNQIVHEITINAGLKDGKTVKIGQITDTHLNAYNNADFAQAHPSVMESSVNPRMFNFNVDFKQGVTSLRTIQQAMEYLDAWGDQMVLTGDIVDGLAFGSLQLVQRHVSTAYPDALVLNGNHDLERMWGVEGNQTTDYASENSRRELLDAHINNDSIYSKKVVNDSVMIIQMDNGLRSGFIKDAYGAQFTADLATARDKGYAVLLFTHVPLNTNNSADTAVWCLRGNDKEACNFAADMCGVAGDKGVYDTILANSDIIKGVFNGHTHADYYTEIQGDAGVIPQYTLNGGNYYSMSEMLKITVQ